MAIYANAVARDLCQGVKDGIKDLEQQNLKICNLGANSKGTTVKCDDSIIFLELSSDKIFIKVDPPIYRVVNQTGISGFLLEINETYVVVSISVELPMKTQKQR